LRTRLTGGRHSFGVAEERVQDEQALFLPKAVKFCDVSRHGFCRGELQLAIELRDRQQPGIADPLSSIKRRRDDLPTDFKELPWSRTPCP
jgi:hypothetical protein